MAHRRRINRGVGGLRVIFPGQIPVPRDFHDQRTIPEEDKQFLRANGFDVAAKLGEGGFGCVFSGVCNTDAKKKISVGPNEILEAPDSTHFDPISRGYFREISLNAKPCAIKKIFDSENWTDSTYNEAKTMRDLDHPNIVEVYEVIKTPTSVYIIMELLNAGTLTSYLSSKSNLGEKLNEATASQIIRQMTAGLQYLHAQNKVHLDLHSGNILLSFDGNRCLAKIADFGLCEALTVYAEGQDYSQLVKLIREVCAATQFKSTQTEEDLKELTKKFLQGKINGINQFADELSRILPLSEAPIEVPKNPLLRGLSKLFQK